jgi:Lipocalin-like domain
MMLFTLPWRKQHHGVHQVRVERNETPCARRDRPKGDGNPRTPVGPMVAYYGTYTVDEAKKSLTYNIEVASAPAFDKAARVQTVALSGDVMTTTASPVKTPEGDIIPVNEWKRAK